MSSDRIPQQVSLFACRWRPEKGKPLPWDIRRRLFKPKGGRNKKGADDNFHNRDYDFVSPSGEVFTGSGIRQFAQKHGLHESCLRNVLDGKVHSHRGWTKAVGGRKLPVPPTYYFLSPTGEIHTTNNLSEFARQHNLCPIALSRISRCIKGSHKGWRHCTAEGQPIVPSDRKHRKFTLLSPDGEVVEGSNLRQFAIAHGLSRTCLMSVLDGTVPHHRGWKMPPLDNATDEYSTMLEKVNRSEEMVVSSAISLHQPWASLIALGLKQYETRSWSTSYRGPLLICSAKLKKELDQKSKYDWLKDKHSINLEDFESLRFGCAIALVELTDCIKMDEAFIQSQSELEIDCGGWAAARYAWKLENIRKVLPMVHIKGRQGLFSLEVKLSDDDLEVIDGDDSWNPAHFGETPRIVESNGQATVFFDDSEEPPEPDDFKTVEEFEEAWKQWELSPEKYKLEVGDRIEEMSVRSRHPNKPILAKDARIGVVLFAGGGGIEAGMVEAGICPVIAVEFDPDKPKFSSAIADCHDRNFSEYGCRVIRETVQKVANDGFLGFPRSPDYLHASPVCSNFSNAKTNGIESDDDKSAALAVASAITMLKPKNFTLENVARYKDSESFQIILAALGLEGYQVAWDIINIADYGLPQARRRLILRASKGIPIGLPQKSAQIGWYEAIAHLIPLMSDSQLVAGQRRAVATFLEGNEPVPLLIKRVGGRDGEYKCKPGHLPCSTLMRSHFTDGKGANRNKFADIWLPDGTVKSLSIEGAAILQGFPNWYELPKNASTAGLLGNSVPSSFAAALFAAPKIPKEYEFLYRQLIARGLSEVSAKAQIKSMNLE
jgi:DNA (cytosine-5)-methyltransferase 1